MQGAIAEGCAGTTTCTSLYIGRSGLPALSRHLYIPVHRRGETPLPQKILCNDWVTSFDFLASFAT